MNNKDILEYAQIAQREPKSRILNIEGRSNEYTILSIMHFCSLAFGRHKKNDERCILDTVTHILGAIYTSVRHTLVQWFFFGKYL